MKKDFENIKAHLSKEEQTQYDNVLATLKEKSKDYDTSKMVFGGVRLVVGMKDMIPMAWEPATPQEGGNSFPVFTFSNGARTGLRNLSNASGWDAIPNRPPMPSSDDELNAFVAWCTVKRLKFEVLDVRQETRNAVQRTVVVFRVYL